MLPCQIVSLPGLTPFDTALERQRELARLRQDDQIPDTLLLLEHPPTITLGRGSRPSDLLTQPQVLQEQGIVVVEVDRGGEISYHAPGQLVGYPILDLRSHGKDLHRYLRDLEEVLIRTVAGCGIMACRIPGFTGVWVRESKIAALGIKVARWVTMHGFALNVSLDLAPMRQDFVPCGIRGKGVTSLLEQQPDRPWSRSEVERMVIPAFCSQFAMTPIPPQTGILSA